MSDYKTLKGIQINVVDSDPSNLFQGQIWYNSSSEKLKVRNTAAGVWTTGGTTNFVTTTAGSCGTQTLALMVAGHKSGNAACTDVESWNGTAWTEMMGAAGSGLAVIKGES